MKHNLLKYGLAVVLAMITSMGLLWADSITSRDSLRKGNDATYVNNSETILISSDTLMQAQTSEAKPDESSHREWWIALVSALVGALFGYSLILLNECRKAKQRKEQYVKELHLLTEAVLKHTKKCNMSIEKCINQLKSSPHEIHDLRRGILVSIERITRLDATMVYEAFESKGKQDDFDDFLNFTDQLLTAYTYTYKEFEDHTDEIVQTTNEFEEIAASIMYDSQLMTANPMILNILTKYESVHPEYNPNPINIKLEYDTLICPLKTYLGQDTQIPINELWKNVDKADYLYQSIYGHQVRFADYLGRRLDYINQTIKAIEEVKL